MISLTQEQRRELYEMNGKIIYGYGDYQNQYLIESTNWESGEKGVDDYYTTYFDTVDSLEGLLSKIDPINSSVEYKIDIVDKKEDD